MTKNSGLAQIAKHVAAKGRDGDTMLAHINPQEAALLKSVGGSGTINPATGLPEYKFGLKKLAKSVGKVVAAPQKLIGTGIEKGLGSVGLGSVGKIAAKPFNLTARGTRAIAKAPYSVASGAVNLVADPGKQVRQIGREAGRTALSPLLPTAVGFIPGIGVPLATGIGAAQGAYRGRKGGLGDALLGAAVGGGTSYLGARGARGLVSGLSGAATNAAGSGFNLGTGTGSIASGIPGLSQYAAPAASGFNLGTGAGSILGGSAALGAAGLGQYAAPIASGFNLGTGTGSIANTLGLGFSDVAESGAAPLTLSGLNDTVKPILNAAGGSGGSGGLDSLLGLGVAGAGVAGLLSLLNGEKPEYKEAKAPQMSEQDKSYYNRPSQSFDWNSIRQGANAAGVSPAELLATNWDKVAGVNAQPIGLRKGGKVPSAPQGALSKVSMLVKGPGSGRQDAIDAKLSDGEYVIDAETVALLGDGSTDAGAKQLDRMREKVRSHKGKALSRGEISPDAKSPLAYLKGVK